MARLLFNSRQILRLSVYNKPLVRYSSSGKLGLVLGVYYEEGKQGLQMTCSADNYNKMVNGKLCESLSYVNNEVKAGKSYVFWGLDKQYSAIAVVGLGEKCRAYDEIERLDQGKEAVRVAASAGCKALEALDLKEICIDDLGDSEAAAEGATLGLWKFQENKSKQRCPPEISLYCGNDEEKQKWARGLIKANAQNIARRLTDMPGNQMTPSIFSQTVRDIFHGMDVFVEIHDEKWIESKGMNAFLAVAQGSCQPPRFLELTYCKGCPGADPFVLVGKGVTFDAGGISLKPPLKMDEMRGDMGGAAVCVAALQALASLCIPVNVKVLIPLTENLPSGAAVKPGDVVKAMNGKSICIDNTDAEGRLILADALAYAECFKPKFVMDIATLTGAIKMSLGDAATGVFSNCNNLYNCLEQCSGNTGDRVWRMPLWKHFTKEMTSYDAYDIKNIGKPGLGGGSCTAAAFLKEFVPKDAKWMHLDIAGVMGPSSSIPYLAKGMSGRPTRTIIDFIDLQGRVRS